MHQIRLLSQSDMAGILDISDVINVIEEGFRKVVSDDDLPDRTSLQISKQPGVALLMPAYLSDLNILGVKIVSVFPNNISLGYPMVTGFYVLCDSMTGQLMALMEGKYLTGIRTAAASAVATKILAREDAKILGVIGTGVQGRFHVDAIRSVRKIEKVVVYSRTPEKRQKFANELETAGIICQQVEHVSQCTAEADILAVCTSSKKPVFDGNLIRPGTHINAVGAFTPDTRELDTNLIQKAQVYVDTYAGAFKEAGDILIPFRSKKIQKGHIQAELSELISGKKKGRTHPEEITVFKSVGYAMEDAVVAKFAYDQANAANIGCVFDIDS